MYRMSLCYVPNVACDVPNVTILCIECHYAMDHMLICNVPNVECRYAMYLILLCDVANVTLRCSECHNAMQRMQGRQVYIVFKYKYKLIYGNIFIVLLFNLTIVLFQLIKYTYFDLSSPRNSIYNSLILLVVFCTSPNESRLLIAC